MSQKDTLGTNACDELERLIDTHGLLHVVIGMQLVCAEKAEHIRSNWQDNLTAKRWDQCAEAFYKLADRGPIQSVS